MSVWGECTDGRARVDRLWVYKGGQGEIRGNGRLFLVIREQQKVKNTVTDAARDFKGTGGLSVEVFLNVFIHSDFDFLLFQKST